MLIFIRIYWNYLFNQRFETIQEYKNLWNTKLQVGRPYISRISISKHSFTTYCCKCVPKLHHLARDLSKLSLHFQRNLAFFLNTCSSINNETKPIKIYKYLPKSNTAGSTFSICVHTLNSWTQQKQPLQI